MASSSYCNLKAAQQLSPAVGNFNVDFNCRMRFLSSLLKRRRWTAAYSLMKALTLPRLVVKVRPLRRRGSANVVEKGVPGTDLIVLQDCSLRRPGVPPISSGGLLLRARGSRHRPTGILARLSATVRSRKFRFLIASRSSGVEQGLVDLP